MKTPSVVKEEDSDAYNMNDENDAEVAAVPNIVDGESLLAQMLGVTIEHLNKIEFEDDIHEKQKEKQRRTKSKRKLDIESKLELKYQNRNNIFIPDNMIS